MLTIMILTILVFGLQLVVSHYTEEGDIPSKNSYKRNMTISIISAIICTILAILFGKNIYDKWIEGGIEHNIDSDIHCLYNRKYNSFYT